MDAAQIANNLESLSPRGDKILPQNEFQLWKWNRDRAYELMDAAQIAANLEFLYPAGYKILPQNEYDPFAGAEPDEIKPAVFSLGYIKTAPKAKSVRSARSPWVISP
jgi:hypothetical protein